MAKARIIVMMQCGDCGGTGFEMDRSGVQLKTTVDHDLLRCTVKELHDSHYVRDSGGYTRDFHRVHCGRCDGKGRVPSIEGLLLAILMTLNSAKPRRPSKKLPTT